jgi:glucose/arabinose dehydrogenase
MTRYIRSMSYMKILVVVTCMLALIGSRFASNDLPTKTKAAAESHKLVEAFPSLEFDAPVELTGAGDNSKRIFVIEQKGKIRVFQNSRSVKASSVFLDIEDKVSSGGETGLLGLAFHPDFKTNGFFYVNYTRRSPLETVIARFKVSSSNPNIADPKSETILLTFDQPYSNHNGGKVVFGNDGLLYIATGDGGSGGDPKNVGQNRKELLGKILRIDVDKPTGGSKYGIPQDNPYAANTNGYREEIYAFGMRNPWRMNFDRRTGLLWAGDVGQNKYEEIDIIEKGGNYGWRILEANDCYQENGCNRSGLIPPIWAYRQGSDTGASVTGGYVCRDKTLPGLNGKYIYGDFVSGNIWALTFAGKKAEKNEFIARISGGLPSFGEDDEGNLYVMNYNPGKIYRLSR